MTWVSHRVEGKAWKTCCFDWSVDGYRFMKSKSIVNQILMQWWLDTMQAQHKPFVVVRVAAAVWIEGLIPNAVRRVGSLVSYDAEGPAVYGVYDV